MLNVYIRYLVLHTFQARAIVFIRRTTCSGKLETRAVSINKKRNSNNHKCACLKHVRKPEICPAMSKLT
jgi:hypothetical protein